MSYDVCGTKWVGRDGKQHQCAEPAHETTTRCTCDCGEKILSAQRPKLKLAHWKRGRKKVVVS